MDRESLDRLRFDRRLQNRRGWLAPGELDRHVEGLPDVAEKMTTLAGEEEAAAAAAQDSGSASNAGGANPS